ncbi:uncharacterized protein BO96DRAFT_19900 [Aspergillus niger CBS 101883]|uniref:uncharacterized protein n=1 Tax=Aspergillus lacticoffeatus (strain CBS 101883) TaxID=1450533 RepID=UPI000D7FD056|nr:uncharacterized protein BO96DRAFT_19900 [Aspergillus niger CBS 101883]PYH62715.1 hypothetical protein BO96DRAFT_19900 [Aspergillus niger CBS 101883]
MACLPGVYLSAFLVLAAVTSLNDSPRFPVSETILAIGARLSACEAECLVGAEELEAVIASYHLLSSSCLPPPESHRPICRQQLPILSFFPSSALHLNTRGLASNRPFLWRFHPASSRGIGRELIGIETDVTDRVLLPLLSQHFLPAHPPQRESSPPPSLLPPFPNLLNSNQIIGAH